jgi:hypothetical protein
MKQDRLGRHLLIGFGLALGLYVAAFWFIEHRRTAQTPWTVWFEADTNGQLRLEISQESLGLGPVEIRFGESNTNNFPVRTRVKFQSPKPVPRPLPVGECLFEDLTFLPGTVVLQVNQTSIQMLPRALTIGTNEFSWRKVRLVEVQSDGICHVVN